MSANDKTANDKLVRNIELLLGIAIVYIVGLFFLKVTNSILFNVNIFEFLISLNPLFAFLASLILVIVTWKYVKETNFIADVNNKNLRHQFILEIQKTYRDQQMGQSLRVLWEFYDKIEDQIKQKEKYDQRIKTFKNENDKEKFDKEIFKKIREEMLKKYEKRIADNRDKLDDKRRLVSDFYQHLYDMSQIDTDLKEYISQNFLDESIKQTIEFILIPMETKLVEIINKKNRIGGLPFRTENPTKDKLKKLSEMITN